MKTWIAVVSLAFGLLVMHGEAHAMRCTMHTITQGGPDGHLHDVLHAVRLQHELLLSRRP